MELCDFKSDLHEEMLLNSTFYSDITENYDKHLNENLSSNDESFENHTINDLGNSDEPYDDSVTTDESFNVHRMNDELLNNTAANYLK